ncbi:MAG: phosphatase PAP2 family protein [Candidatus Aminicenantes bacterium]|nr:phosphatase PAP2 family protein [Candidatus Aminicenantes bacterium]
MFQTEIIIWLQSFASDFLTVFFKFFTGIGRGNATVPIVVAIMFGVNFRFGFLLAHAVVWNGLITDFLKNFFALPRPANVDSNVLLPEKGYPNPTTFESMGAKSFFGKLPGEVVEHLRVHRIDSWGFPSGHAGNAVTLWGSLALHFKKTWVRAAAIIFIICITLSRMYLGRHFLADVLGGLFIGVSVTIVFYKFVFKNEKLWVYLFEEKKIGLDRKSLIFTGYFLLLPLLLFFLPHVNPRVTAVLLGLNISFILLRFRGLPEESGGILKRIARVLISAVLFFGMLFLLTKVAEILFAGRTDVSDCFVLVIATAVSVWAAAGICIKLGLYSRGAGN